MFALPPSFTSIEVGQKFTGRLTVTEAHVVLASGIFADFAPLHVDETFAQQTRYGTRIAHGTLITGIMTGVLSKALGPNALGLLDYRRAVLGARCSGRHGCDHLGGTGEGRQPATRGRDRPARGLLPNPEGHAGGYGRMRPTRALRR